MSFIYKLYKYYYPNKDNTIKSIVETNNTIEGNTVICAGSGCKNSVYVKINKPKFPLCLECIEKYSKKTF